MVRVFSDFTQKTPHFGTWTKRLISISVLLRHDFQMCIEGILLPSDRSIHDPVIELFQDTLGRPIAFHPVFVELTGSVTAALLLSQAVYWTKRIPSGDWFYKTMRQWEEETKLSRHEQESARKLLRRFSFWQEERRGVPAQMYFRVDIRALYNELLSVKKAKRALSSLPESGKLECRNTSNKNAGKRQTGMPESGNHNKGITETTPEITSKTTTTATPLTSHHETPGYPVSRRFIENCLSGTILRGADPGRIVQAAKQYRRSQEEVEALIHALDGQYRGSTCRIQDPTALLVSCLRDAIIPPENASLAKQDAVEAGYREYAEKLEALPEQEREEILVRARARLHPVLHNSVQAVKATAVGILISQARAPS